jgi:hypothetical protein
MIFFTWKKKMLLMYDYRESSIQEFRIEAQIEVAHWPLVHWVRGDLKVSRSCCENVHHLFMNGSQSSCSEQIDCCYHKDLNTSEFLYF